MTILGRGGNVYVSEEDIWQTFGIELNTNAARYQVSSVLSGERAETVLGLIADMVDSKTVQIAYHANDPNVGLANAKDLRKFKLYLADTGLLTTLIFKDKDFTENIYFSKRTVKA